MLRTAPAVAAVLAFLVAQPAAAGSLPGVSSGHRPGPDALYAPAPEAPQLENTRGWEAEPILVSGAEAYRDGEWLYQDFLFDDHGAAGVPDTTTPYDVGGFLFSPPAGTFTYPTDPVYGHNAADLVELRVRPLADATAFRVTLNTLNDPERTAFTIALGESDTAHEWPHGAGVSSPAQLFLTVHGSAAELVDAASGEARPGASAVVDAERRQVHVRVPHSAWAPGTGKVRTTVGVGLWDPGAGSYLAPSTDSASATTPGGGAPTGPAIVNVGPRFDEPWPEVTQFGAGWTIADSAAGAAVQAAWWRERKQADALRLGDVSSFVAEVDFAKLAAAADDDSAVPETGPMNRILASRHEFGQGMDPEKVCFDLAGGFDAGAKCVGRFVGRLQPYALYVPDRPRPKEGWGLTLLLHSLSGNHNQYADSKNQSQLGERGAGSLVVTPAGRGPDGFYQGIAEADTFEVWADVARRYELDPGRAAVSGYSMGGFGTYRLLTRWPDLFARGFSVVGAPGSADDQLPSLRNTPLLLWNAAADELVNMRTSEQAVSDLTDAGVRFIHDLFPGADHLTLATNDEYGQGADWLAGHRVDRDPAHVTYVVDPVEDNAEAQAVADHAYWLSGLELRDRTAAPTGTIDARSEAFAVADPDVLPHTTTGGALTGGAHGPMPYVEREQAWSEPKAAPKADRLVLAARNLAAATVDLRRARLSCSPTIEVESDGPLALRLACGPPAVRAAGCSSRNTFGLPRLSGARIRRATAARGARVLRRARGSDLRRLTVRRSSRRAHSVRITLRTSDAKLARVVLTRRVPACS